MSLWDEKNPRTVDEEDFSDITEFRPEKDAFFTKGPVPMEEDRTIRTVQRPWVIALMLGIALILAGAAVLYFSSLTTNQRTKVTDASSLIPESRITGATEQTSEPTEITSVTIPGKTKATEITESDTEESSGDGSETESGSENESSSEEEAVQKEVGGVLFLLKDGEATILECRSADSYMAFGEDIEGCRLEGIDDEAFKGCTHLRVLELPDSLCWIGARAFEGCENLTEIYLGETVNAISEEAFDGAEHVVIVAPEGSYAAGYAAEKGIAFRAR